ncbi:DUF3429 domain-containing protein [Solimonas marina]|uniref:DUF3429 domain-containing protein n=1 Tax=Solimonas marina TaxID=2714601 RepID=A0A970B4G1_9GAMM|nr:DUF3429 domain-containing protein [Solimonas marina]NKF22297.1 DUF3429 domain-containing protein [Solimonas marina]
MKLPPLLSALGYAGLLPFFAGPLWMTLSPETVPAWLDPAWQRYAGFIAAFMAGSFWGVALMVSGNPAGLFGACVAAALLVCAWASMLLPSPWALLALAVVFILQALAEIWRERVLDPVGSYFRLRITLTVGVVACLIWRLCLG